MANKEDRTPFTLNFFSREELSRFDEIWGKGLSNFTEKEINGKFGKLHLCNDDGKTSTLPALTDEEVRKELENLENTEAAASEDNNCSIDGK